MQIGFSRREPSYPRWSRTTVGAFPRLYRLSYGTNLWKQLLLVIKFGIYAEPKRDYKFVNSGSHLLSHIVSNAVPSAATVLTVVFGMGTGVSP